MTLEVKKKKKMGPHLSLIGDSTPVNTNIYEESIAEYLSDLSVMTSTGWSFANQLSPLNIAITRRHLTDILATLLFNRHKNFKIDALVLDSTYGGTKAKIEILLQNISNAIANHVKQCQTVSANNKTPIKETYSLNPLFPTDCLVQIIMIKMVLFKVFHKYEYGYLLCDGEGMDILRELPQYCDPYYKSQYESVILLILKWIGYDIGAMLQYYRIVSPYRRSMNPPLKLPVPLDPAVSEISYPCVVILLCEYINEQILKYHRLIDMPLSSISSQGRFQFTGFYRVSHFIQSLYHTLIKHHHNEEVTQALQFTSTLLLRQRCISLAEWNRSWQYLFDMLTLQFHKDHVVRFILSVMMSTLDFGEPVDGSRLSGVDNAGIVSILQSKARMLSATMFGSRDRCRMIPRLMMRLLEGYSVSTSATSPLPRPNSPPILLLICQWMLRMLQFPCIHDCLIDNQLLTKAIHHLLIKLLYNYREDKPYATNLFLLICSIGKDNGLLHNDIELIKVVYEFNQWYYSPLVLHKLFENRMLFQHVIVNSIQQAYVLQYEEVMLLLLTWFGYDIGAMLQYYRIVSPYRRSMNPPLKLPVPLDPAVSEISYPCVVILLCEYINEQILKYHRLIDMPLSSISSQGRFQFTGFYRVSHFIQSLYHTLIKHHHNEEVTQALQFTSTLLLRQRCISLAEWNRSWQYLFDMLTLQFHKDHVVRFILSVMMSTLDFGEPVDGSRLSGVDNAGIVSILQSKARMLSATMFGSRDRCRMIPRLMMRLLEGYSVSTSATSPLPRPNSPPILLLICQWMLRMLQFPCIYNLLIRDKSLVKRKNAALTALICYYREDKPLAQALFLLICTIGNNSDISTDKMELIKVVYELNQWYGCSQVLYKLFEHPHLFQQVIVNGVALDPVHALNYCNIISIRCHLYKHNTQERLNECAIFTSIQNMFEYIARQLPKHWVKDSDVNSVVSDTLASLLNENNKSLMERLRTISSQSESLFQDDYETFNRLIACFKHYAECDTMLMNVLKVLHVLCQNCSYYLTILTQCLQAPTLYEILIAANKRNKHMASLVISLIWTMLSELSFHVSLVEDRSVFLTTKSDADNAVSLSASKLGQWLIALDVVIPGLDRDAKLKAFLTYISLAASNSLLPQTAYEIDCTAAMINRTCKIAIVATVYDTQYVVTVLENCNGCEEMFQLFIRALAIRLRYRHEQEMFDQRSYEIAPLILERLEQNR